MSSVVTLRRELQRRLTSDELDDNFSILRELLSKYDTLSELVGKYNLGWFHYVRFPCEEIHVSPESRSHNVGMLFKYYPEGSPPVYRVISDQLGFYYYPESDEFYSSINSNGEPEGYLAGRFF